MDADFLQGMAGPNTAHFDETIGGALIDAARISVVAAAREFADVPRIVLPGDEQTPTVQACLAEAMIWLDAARALTLEQAAAPPTSLHSVSVLPR